MSGPVFDAIVIGGGVCGAGVLRDLALRGVRALLVERAGLGMATTRASSHLIHGGLRYLLYDRFTTRVTCWDSGNIVRIARPHLTRMPILWPVYDDHRRGMDTVEALLESYDSFQTLKEGKRHLRLSAATVRQWVPGLKTEGLLGGIVFDEYWVDPVRLVQALVDSACRAGAQVRTRSEALRLEPSSIDGRRAMAVRLRSVDGTEETVRARVAVNAAGPWATEVAKRAGTDLPLRFQKGSHLVFPPGAGSWGRAFETGLLLEAADRQRYIFILPGPEETLVGPTDIATHGHPDSASTEPTETAYLAESVRRYFPSWSPEGASTRVGVRPLLGQAGPEKLLSRGYRVVDHGLSKGPEAFVSVVGGKMSDFRLMAQDAGDAVAEKIGGVGPSVSAEWTLEGNRAGTPPAPRPPEGFWTGWLNGRPRLREGQSLACLAGALGRHWTRRLLRGSMESTLEQARAHYSKGSTL